MRGGDLLIYQYEAAAEMRTISHTFHERGEKQQQENQYHQHHEEITGVAARRVPFPRPPILRTFSWSALHEAEPVPTGCSLHRLQPSTEDPLPQVKQ